MYWWLYDPQDHDLLFRQKASPEERRIIEDQGKCYGTESCYLLNSKLNSTGNFENKCCLLKSHLYNTNYCSIIFSGKYFESNLYSINHAYDNNFTYDCDGTGDQTFNPSLYESSICLSYTK